uniref:Uncharacterized protein n=1 Tax=Clytia hemisphaerica TaxID=252671 RepID=A0A7M5XIH2_9CNID
MESQDQRLSTEVVTMQPTGSSVALASPQDTAAICGLLSRNFVDGIKQDQYPGIFTFESDGSIRHDSDKMPFFSRKKKIAGISFPTAESTEICCRSIDDLRRLKERLLNNRFMFKGKMYVVNGQFSGIQCRVHERCVLR